MYKLDRHYSLRNRIVDAEVKKLELRQSCLRLEERSDRRAIVLPDHRR